MKTTFTLSPVITFTALFIGMLTFMGPFGCADNSNSAESGNLSCADGNRVFGQLCDGIADCSDNSDEVECDPGCVNQLPAEQLCDGIEDCAFGSDEINCENQTCEYPDGARCDGVETCFDGADEADCTPQFEATVRNPSNIFSGSPVTLAVEGVEPSQVKIGVNNASQETIARDGMVSFRMPELNAGEVTVSVGAGELGRVDLSLQVQEAPQPLHASEAVQSFSNDMQTMLPATESTISAAQNFSIPTTLLQANENVLNSLNDTLPTLDSNENSYVANTVEKTLLLMGAESPEPQPKNRGDSTTCQTLQSTIQDYADRVRTGVNIMSVIIQQQASQTDISTDAKTVATGIIYAYWSYLLRGVLQAYDQYITDCSTVQMQLTTLEPPGVLTSLPSATSDFPTAIGYQRQLLLDQPNVITSMKGCQLALVDATQRLSTLLGLPTDSDYSSLTTTEWTETADPSVAYGLTIADASPAVLYFDQQSDTLAIEWQQTLAFDKTFDLPIKITDPKTGTISIFTVSINVTGTTSMCAVDPSTTTPLLDSYIAGVSVPIQGSPLLLGMTFADNAGTTELTVTPYVRDYCGTEPAADGCQNNIPRDVAGETLATTISLTDVPITASFDAMQIERAAYAPTSTTTDAAYDISLSFVSCGSGSDFCGSITITPVGTSNAVFSQEFAAIQSSDPSAVQQPPTSCL